MKNKRIIIISLCIVLSLVGLLYYANFVKVSAKEMFEQDGYVLSDNLENVGNDKEPSQFYFKANSAYEKKWPSKVLFHDTESSKVVLENQTFLHYTNGDMGAFADGVLVDLSALEQTPINYYRIQAGAILKKVGDTFQMNHLGKKVTMTNALWKLSDSKYVIISPEMKINLGANNVKDVKGYLEVEIKDKGIISLRNQNVSYQTVVEGSKVELSDGTILDFNNKNIMKNNKIVFSLTQMVVDSNSNIEIVPEENKSNPPTENPSTDPTKPNADANTPGNGSNTPGAGGNGGNGEKEPDINLGDIAVPEIPDKKPGGDEATGDNVVPKLIPSVTLTSLKASIVGVNINATINDKDDLLTSAGVDVKIFEKSSNKLVYNMNTAKGIQKIEQDIQSLKTNMEYVLVISGTYVLNNVEYTTDFLNKQFKTDMLDLNYKVNEKTSTTLSYKVFTDKGTKITSASLILYTADKIESQRIQLTKEELQNASQEEGHLVEFSFLQPNTAYFTRIMDVVYDDSMTVNEYDTFVETKTLKTTPTLTKPSASIDKRNGTVGLFPGDVTDPNNGIQKYRYEIIDALDTTNVVYNSERDIKGNVEVSIDGKQIQRKHNYFWRLIAIFNDNDKLVEVPSPESDIFSLDTNNLPNLTFEPTTIQHDSILGNININDAENVILRGEFMVAGQLKPSTIKIYATDPVSQSINIGAAASTEVPADWNGTMSIPIDIPNGLRANETETFKIYADVNLGEEPPTGGSAAEYNRSQYYLGELRVRTGNVAPIRVTADKNSSTEPAILNEKFVLNTRLSAVTAEENVLAEYTASTLENLNYSIYRGIVPPNETAIADAAAQLVATGRINASAGTAEAHNSSIKTDLFDQEGEIRSSNITYDWSKLGDMNATIVFHRGRDYVGNIVSLGETADRVFSFQVNGERPALPKNDNDAVDYQLIRNSQLAPGTDWTDLGTSPKPDLNNDTIVGMSFLPRLNNSAGVINTIRYTIREVGGTADIFTRVESLRPHDTNVPRIVVPIGDGVDGVGNDSLRRGHQYMISYEVDLDLNYDGVAETFFENRAGGRDFNSTQLNIPRQTATFKTKLNYTSTGGVANIQYYLKDVDASYRQVQGGADNGKLIVNFELTPVTGATVTIKKEVSRSRNANDWKTIQLNDVTSGTIAATTSISKFNQAGTVETISTQRIYPPLANIETYFKAETEIANNHLNVTIKKADTKTDAEFKKALAYITGAQITVADTADATDLYTTDIMQLQSVNDGSADARIRVPLTALSKLREKALTVSTKFYYINGNATTNRDGLTEANTKLYAVEIVNPSSAIPSYLYDNEGTSLIQQSQKNYPANASIFKVIANGGILNFENKTNKNTTIYSAENTGFPLKISIGTTIVQNVKLKELSEATIATDSSTLTSGFDAVSGFISVSNEDGNLNIVKGIDRAELTYTVDMTGATAPKGNKIYFELYQLQSGSTTDFETTAAHTYSADIATGPQTISLSGLQVGQTYKLKEYIKFDKAQASGAPVEKNQYLYDVDKKVVGYEYIFKTSDKVVVSNMNATLENSRDTTGTITKKMKLSYNLDQIGFTKIEYDLKEFNTTTSAYDIDVLKESNTDESSFKKAMTMNAPIGNATGKLKLGVRYKIQIRIFSTKNPYGTPETQLSNDATSSLEFQLAPLRSPIVNIQLLPGLEGVNNVITASINVNDSDYASTTNKYTVKLLDDTGTDITPDAIKTQEYDFATKNNQIKFENGGTTTITANKEYTVEVTTKVDLYQNGTVTDSKTKADVMTLNSFGVALGDMEIVKNASSGRADLQFYGSINLNKVKKISYTLYNSATGTSVSMNDVTFTITSQGSGVGQYWKHTISGFTTAGRYSVQVMFLTEGNEMIGSLNSNFVYN